jgi:hypothetical protein
MGRLDQTEQKGDREENPKRASPARTSDQAISKIPKKLWGDLTQILDSVHQLMAGHAKRFRPMHASVIPGL